MFTSLVMLLMAVSAFAGALAAGWRPAQRRGCTSHVEARQSAADPAAAQPEGAVAVLDVDDLAGLNAQNDFDTGDRLLSGIEDTLRRSLPDGLEVERMESGRFLIWLPQTDIDSAAHLVERLRSTASQAYVDGVKGPTSRTLSAGLALTSEDQEPGRAVLHADSAVAHAKLRGGNRLEIIDAGASPPSGPTRGDIEAGIQSGALSYHVQPIVETATNRIVGVEALLRWKQADGAVVGPAQFAEHLDRIPELAADLFPVLAVEAAEAFVRRPDPIFFTLNISAAILDDSDGTGCRWLNEVLLRLPPEQIIVEIVETAVIAQPARALELVARLRKQGVRVALDDFGTGLSNLDRLRQMPVDFLKIDRTFIVGIGTGGREETILRNVIRMAADLGMEIIAEGVEEAHQAEAVRSLGIRYAQGYFFGRPGPAADWDRRLP